MSHPAPHVARKRKHWGEKQEKMIEGRVPPIFIQNVHLTLMISAALVQIGYALVNGSSQGEGRTKLDSHANMCVIEKHYYLLSELSMARRVSAGAFTE